MSDPQRHLVLLGGGHTHSLVLRGLCDEPLPGMKVTLVSDVEEAPYSGMLPGHVAGLYTHDEMHIDLPRLCRRAGADFVLAEVTGVNPEDRTVCLADREPLEATPDILSINVGSAPRLDLVPGAAEFAIPSKPVPRLLSGWSRAREAAAYGGAVRIALVGGGAGGVELALAMKAQLPSRSTVSLIHGGEEILPGHTASARRALSRALAMAGVGVRTRRKAVEVAAEAVVLDNGEAIGADFVFWVTNPAPPPWLKESGLPVDEKGFLRVDSTLEASGLPGVFAAGDVASIRGADLPKAGVFAVRMAIPLVANLRAACAGQERVPYRPQGRFLSLVGTADGRAVISRPGIPALRSHLVWAWKDRIDRRFMGQF